MAIRDLAFSISISQDEATPNTKRKLRVVLYPIALPDGIRVLFRRTSTNTAVKGVLELTIEVSAHETDDAVEHPSCYTIDYSIPETIVSAKVVLTGASEVSTIRAVKRGAAA